MRRSQLGDASLCEKGPLSSGFEHYKLSNREVACNTNLCYCNTSCGLSTIETEGTKLSTGEPVVITITDDNEEEKTLAGSVVQPDKESSKPIYQSNKIDGNNKRRRIVLDESSNEENARLSMGKPSKSNEDTGTVSNSWDDLRRKMVQRRNAHGLVKKARCCAVITAKRCSVKNTQKRILMPRLSTEFSSTQSGGV